MGRKKEMLFIHSSSNVRAISRCLGGKVNIRSNVMMQDVEAGSCIGVGGANVNICMDMQLFQHHGTNFTAIQIALMEYLTLAKKRILPGIHWSVYLTLHIITEV